MALRPKKQKKPSSIPYLGKSQWGFGQTTATTQRPPPAVWVQAKFDLGLAVQKTAPPSSAKYYFPGEICFQLGGEDGCCDEAVFQTVPAPVSDQRAEAVGH
jgi:hypothetical protein